MTPESRIVIGHVLDKMAELQDQSVPTATQDILEEKA